MVKSSRTRSIPLAELEQEYLQMFGHNLPVARVGVDSLESLIAVLQSWVRVADGKDGPQVVTVDRGFIRTLANNVRRLLVEQQSGAMNYEDFVTIMAAR